MARNLNAVNLQLKSCIGGTWKNSTSNTGSYVVINGVNHKIVDYACMIGGVWRYAPSSDYAWEKWSVKTEGSEYNIYIDDSERSHKYWEIWKTNIFCYEEFYDSIELTEDGEIQGVGSITSYTSISSGDYWYDGDDWYYIDRVEIGYYCGTLDTLDIWYYPVYVEGGITTSPNVLIDKVYADTQIYPIDGIHTDGYWYKLIASPYIWDKYSISTTYNWNKYEIDTIYSEYRLYLSNYDGTVEDLENDIDDDYSDAQEFIQDWEDFDDTLPVYSGNSKISYPYYTSISLDANNNIVGSGSGNTKYLDGEYVYGSEISGLSDGVWYYVVDEYDDDWYLFEVVAEGIGTGTEGPGKRVGTVSSTSESAYPNDPNGGKSGTYWYKKTESITTKTKIGQVTSDNANTYPNPSGTHTDGYYYELIKSGT